MNIRKLTINDREQMLLLQKEFIQYNLLNLHKGKFGELIDYDNVDREVHEEFDSFLQEEKIVYVAESDNKIYGYITGGFESKPNRKYKKRGMIYDFFVTEKSRKQGIGELLYKAIVKDFNDAKCDLITLNALVTNEKSIKLYEEWGFTIFKLGLIKKI